MYNPCFGRLEVDVDLDCQGYTLTGRTGVFPSYEAFLGIVHTMMVQYSKFTKLVRLTSLPLELPRMFTILRL